MSKHKNSPTCPILDMLTSDELHRAALRAVLVRRGVPDPDAFMEENTLSSQVMYRDVRVSDGTTMMASVVITKATPKPADTDPGLKGQTP